MLDHCEREGIGFIPWFPLSAGNLSRDFKPLRRVAESLGRAPMQVAVSWLLQRSPAMLPIPGTASMTHLEENTAAAELRLSPKDFAALSNG